MPHRLLGVAVRGEKTHEVLALIYGATEILASPVLAGRDRTASLDLTMHLLGRVARSLVPSPAGRGR